MKPILLGIAWFTSLFFGTTIAQSSSLPLKCYEQVDQELVRTGLSGVVKSTKSIDPAVFVKNDVGQYPAYLLVDDAASKTLVGELLSRREGDDVPADDMITFRDEHSSKITLFVKNKRIVGYSSEFLSRRAGKSVVLDSQCQPASVHITLTPISPPYLNPVIRLNATDCSHQPELIELAKGVEIGENESLFDGICHVRGGVVRPANHSIDDDLVCECPAGTIEPELEEWSGSSRTCLSTPKASNADRFAALISSKSSLVNGGLQALVADLKNPKSEIAQQCRLYFPISEFPIQTHGTRQDAGEVVSGKRG